MFSFSPDRGIREKEILPYKQAMCEIKLKGRRLKLMQTEGTENNLALTLVDRKLRPGRTTHSLTGNWGVTLLPWYEEFDGFPCRVINLHNQNLFTQFTIKGPEASLGFSPTEQRVVVCTHDTCYIALAGLLSDPVSLAPLPQDQLKPMLWDKIGFPSNEIDDHITAVGVSDSGRVVGVSMEGVTIAKRVKVSESRWVGRTLPIPTHTLIKDLQVNDDEIMACDMDNNLLSLSLDSRWLLSEEYRAVFEHSYRVMMFGRNRGYDSKTVH